VADEPGGIDAEKLAEQIAAFDVADFVVTAASTLASLAYAKVDSGDLKQAKLAIDGLAALAPLLEGDFKRDLGAALANLQVAYADAASKVSREGL